MQVLNFEPNIPAFEAKRKNKNDFYRFLLSKNAQGLENKKTNNDLLIPRSILKRNNPVGLIKDKRLKEATEEYLSYQASKITATKSQEEQIGKYDALFGQNIQPGNPLLDPKVKQWADTYLEQKHQEMSKISAQLSTEQLKHTDLPTSEEGD